MGRQNISTMLMRYQLSPIAYAKDGYFFKWLNVYSRSALIAHGARTTGKNNALNVWSNDWNLVKRMDFAINIKLAYTASY